MMPKMSRFGYLSVGLAGGNDNLKGVLARSKRKSRAPVTLPLVKGYHACQEEKGATETKVRKRKRG